MCYVINTNPHRDKFASRTSKCIFLGYSYGQKGYKIYNLHTHLLFTSRDVQFYEHVLPYRADVTSTTNAPIIVNDLPYSITPIDSHTHPTFPSSFDALPTDSSTIPKPTTWDLIPVPYDDTTDTSTLISLQHPSSPIPSSPMLLRRSTRSTSKPTWMEDYVVNHSSFSPYLQLLILVF